MTRLILFLILSIPLTAYSWPFLRRPRSHGFYRFFAFESILVLVLLNVPTWLTDPFSPRQLLSWLLLILSAALAIHGFMLLHSLGRPTTGIETTTQLVRQGAYRYIRHPLYASLLFLAWGAFLKGISPWSAALVLVATLALYATAKAEERENLDKFGESYAAYIQETRMFIPYIF